MDGRVRPASGAGEEPAAEELAAQVEELRRLVEVQRALGRADAATLRATRAQLRETEAERTALRREYTAFRARRSVRAGAAVADRLRRLRAAAGRHPAPPAPPAEHPPAVDSAATVARLVAAAAAPARTDGPLVSIVMLTRNGAAHLRRTLPALATSAYRNMELIVVDNASTDDSAMVLGAYAPGFPVTVIRNERNASYADANNAAVRACRGDLVLLLNNDVQPVGPHWLGHLVESIEAPDVAAVGARLVYPLGEAGPRAGSRFADLTLQHGGVWFAPVDGAPQARPIGAGDDPVGPSAAAVRDVPALTAACLLVRRAAFEVVGGFDAAYFYGLEYVDLALRWRAAGWRLVYDGRAVLWHHESATRVLDDRAARRERSAANRERFVGTWACRLSRTTLLDAIAGGAGGGFWRPPLQVGIVNSPSGPVVTERVEALRGRGWAVREVAGSSTAGDVGSGTGAVTGRQAAFAAVGAPEPPLDVLLLVDAAHDPRPDPGGLIRVGIVDASDTEAWLAAPWLPDLDLVVAANAASAERITVATGMPVTVAQDPLAPSVVRDALTAWVGARRVTIRSAAPSWDVATSWGDLHFARDLQRALRRLGRPTRIQLRDEWREPWAARDDVAINLLGVSEPPCAPGQVNVLWHISHPDMASSELYERHDLVFVASDPFAAWMRDRVSVPVRPLHQATDPDRFAPGRDGPPHELLFVANSRGVRRHVLDDLLPTDRKLAVYGRGWTPERLDPRHLAGELVPNEDLAGFYAAAGIVLNDHWTDMQREGFLSNRLYDASAAGAFVISDAIDGLREEFDGGVVAYRGRDELHALVEAYLADPDARAARAARARAAVLARHTFDLRAREILAEAAPLEAARPPAVVP